MSEKPASVDLYPLNHEFCQDLPPVPGECTYTWPDGWMCGYRKEEHPIPEPAEYTGN